MSLASPPETIPLDSVNAHSNDSFESSETKIKKIIEAYEDSNKSFAALGVPKKEIFDRIREILSSDLNIELEYLYEADFHSFNMIISAFFGRKCALEMPLTEESREVDLLSMCNHPLHTIIVMCYSAHSMKNLFKKEGSGLELEQEKYETLKEHFENIACKTVNHLYYLRNTGPERVRAALQANYKSENTSNENMGFHEDYLNRKFNKSKEILGIAYKAEAMKFLSQKPCFNLMKYRFESRDRVKNKCRGAYIIRKIHQMVDWRPSMQFKLWSHAVFRIIYILIFAYMLCRFPIYDEYDRLDKRNWEDFIPFVYVLSVLLAHLSMICMKLIDFMSFERSSTISKKSGCLPWFSTFCSLLFRYFSRNELAFLRVLFMFPLFSLEAIRFAIATLHLEADDHKGPYHGVLTLIPITLELLYCSLFIITTITSLRFFYLFQSLGFFVYMIKRMLKTVGVFVFIFITFWFVLAVVHVSISRVFMSSNNTIIHTVSARGKFEIFGEVQDEDRIGILSGCSNYTKTIHDILSMDYEEASCLFRTTIVPILVFVYIFLAAILLVNLLTAQLTKEYEKEYENSRYYSGYLYYEQLCKIESKIFLPPPLSLIYVAIRFIFFLITLLFFLFKLCKIGGWCDHVRRFLWKYSIEKIDGKPYQSVKEYVDKYNVEDEIKEFLKKKVDDPWIKIKNLICQFENTPSNFDNLKRAHRKILKIFEKEMLIEIKRDDMLTRLESRMDDNPAEEVNIPYFFSS